MFFSFFSLFFFLAFDSLVPLGLWCPKQVLVLLIDFSKPEDLSLPFIQLEAGVFNPLTFSH